MNPVGLDSYCVGRKNNKIPIASSIYVEGLPSELPLVFCLLMVGFNGMEKSIVSGMSWSSGTRPIFHRGRGWILGLWLPYVECKRMGATSPLGIEKCWGTEIDESVLWSMGT